MEITRLLGFEKGFADVSYVPEKERLHLVINGSLVSTPAVDHLIGSVRFYLRSLAEK